MQALFGEQGSPRSVADRETGKTGTGPTGPVRVGGFFDHFLLMDGWMDDPEMIPERPHNDPGLNPE